MTGAKKESTVKYRNGSAENPQVSVIIPAKNEAQGIESIIRRVGEALDETGHSYEIIVVDDGSTDETAEKAHEAGATVLRHPYNIGNGAAIKNGIRYARGFRLVMLDADGQHPPEKIPALLKMLKKYHMVVGARTSDSETSFHRNLANRIYNRFALYVCSSPIADLTSGFRAIRAGAAKRFRRTSAQHLFLPYDDNTGHRALWLQPRLRSDNEPETRSGH